MLEFDSQALTASDDACFREVIARIVDGVVVVDPEGVVRYANPAAGALLGIPAESLSGTLFGRPVVPGETTEVDLWPGRALLPPPPPRVAEMRVSRVVWRGEPALLASLRDITERKKSEAATRFLAEASCELAVSLDIDTTLASVGRLAIAHLADWCLIDLLESHPGSTGAGVRRVAATRREACRSRAEHLGGHYPLRGAPALARVIRDGWMEVHTEVTLPLLESLALAPGQGATLAGLPCRSLLLVPMLARGQVLGVVTFAVGPECGSGPDEQALAQDLADRAALAIDSARLYDAAQESIRRRDEFLAVLAHELRNPLAAILHAAQLMRLSPSDSEVPRATVERQGQHLTRLLDDLLDLSRVAHGRIDLRRRPLDLAEVVSDAVHTVRPLIESRRHTLRVEVSTGPIPVEGDPTRLTQVLANLLSNAARYTEPGGELVLSAARESGEATLRVRDNGTGLDPADLGRIFEPFTQGRQATDRPRGGLGLGLTLVRRLVELHGGTVEAASDGPGRGSSFTVRLPLNGEPTPESETQDLAPEQVAENPLRVLLVEDNHDGRAMLSELLRLWGHEVEGVADGQTGLERIRAEQPDAALIDIGLPEMDGYTLAREVRGSPGGDRVLLIAVTGYGLPEDLALSREAGFDAHLVKPVDLDRLARLLAGGRRGLA